ncbi:MAG TPA: hypothetical protein VFZ34_15885 [Blastocatellia bacterium]|nr:hypothetical protein [Blastocatellia bacterium]
MQTSAVKQAVKIGAQVAHVGLEAERMKERMTHAVEDTVKAAKRAAKQGRYAVEDLVDEAAHTVKRHPLQSVGWTLGVGFAIGTLFGLALSRMKFPTRCCESDVNQ